MAPQLSKHFKLVIADLPGYGFSEVPKTDSDHTPYTKRAMGRVMVEVMARLGHERFSIVGHDRGGRVAYRLALDHPERLSQVAVLDILPTYDYWTRLDRIAALRIFHWTFLAQPHPMPENLISKSLDDFLGASFASGFDPRAVRCLLRGAAAASLRPRQRRSKHGRRGRPTSAARRWRPAISFARKMPKGRCQP